MKFIAVSSIKQGDKIVGANVLNLVTLKLQSATYEGIEKALRTGEKIRNIELREGKICWVQGAENRYPSVDRADITKITDKDNITVVGYYERKRTGEKVYVIANYRGEVKLLSEDKVEQFSKNYKLTNCKVVDKNGKYYIVSLYGDLDNIGVDSKPVFKIENKKGNIHVWLPIGDFEKLDIPESCKITAKNVDVRNVYIEPELMRNTVRHLEFDVGFNCFVKVASNMMANVTKITFKDTLVRVLDNAYKMLPNVVEIEAEGIEGGSSVYFSNIKKLEHINLKNIPKAYIGTKFRGCNKLDFKNILAEGVEEIGAYVFDECLSLRELVLPKTLRTIECASFVDCRNIKKVWFKGAIDIRETTYRNYDIFKGNKGHIDIYCGHDFPVKILDRYTTADINIIKQQPNKKEQIRDLELEKKLAKAKLLGIEIDSYDIANNEKAALTIINSLSTDSIEYRAQQCIKYALTMKKGAVAVIGEGGLFVRVMAPSIDSFIGTDIDNDTIFYTKNYAIRVVQVKDKEESNILIMPMTRDKILEMMKEPNIPNIGSRFTLSNNREAYVLNLPMKLFRHKLEKITNVIEDGNTLILKTAGENEYCINTIEK